MSMKKLLDIAIVADFIPELHYLFCYYWNLITTTAKHCKKEAKIGKRRAHIMHSLPNMQVHIKCNKHNEASLSAGIWALVAVYIFICKQILMFVNCTHIFPLCDT